MVKLTSCITFLAVCVDFTFASDCCSEILLDVDQGSEVHTWQGDALGFYKQEGLYGARPQYRQVGGRMFLFYSMEFEQWLVTPHHVGNSSADLSKITSSYCPGGLHGWKYGNGSHWLSTSDQDSKPLTSSCASLSSTCCKSVNISSPDLSNHTSTGIFTAIGASTGRYSYQKKGMDRYLEFDNVNNNWFIKELLGQDEGLIYHEGGSVCPEKASNQWLIYDHDDSEWKEDPELTITCIEEEENMSANKEEKPQATIKERVVQQELEKDKLSHEIEASPFISPCDPGSDSSGIVLGLSLFSALLLIILFFLLARRFRRSWSHGAQGSRLVKETLDINCNA